MLDQAEAEHAAHAARPVVAAGATGWDPYEVWLTRFRPWQQQMMARMAQAPKRPRRRVRALAPLNCLLGSSRLVTRLKVLLGVQLS